MDSKDDQIASSNTGVDGNADENPAEITSENNPRIVIRPISESFFEEVSFQSESFFEPKPHEYTPDTATIWRVKHMGERERIAHSLETGVNILLGASQDVAQGQSLLCLQVIVNVGFEHIQREFKDIAVNTPSENPSIYELDVADAALLLDYSAFWICSASVMIAKLGSLRERVFSSDLQRRLVADNSQPQSTHTEGSAARNT